MLIPNFKAVVYSLMLATIMFSCNSNATTDAEENKTFPDSSGAPVETSSPNSNYKPAYPGQTRAPGIKTTTPINITVLSSSLDHPWAICNFPNGKFLLTEKTGAMKIITADGKPDKTLSGLPKVVSSGQGGLLDVNIDPQFASNRMIYWDYAEQATDGTLLAIAKGRLSDDETRIEQVSVIYRANPAYKGTLQYGSRIVFDKAGNLLVSTGERSASEIRVQAQYLNSSLGKILHLTKDGKAVSNGPFSSNADAKPEVYAYGFRNPNGLAWNPQTGELWESEFGPRGGDEINIIRPGKNYGWPLVTYGIEYTGEKVGEGIQQKEGVEQPVYYWDPVISPAGIAFYNSDVIPEWKGNLFVSSLSGTHIARLVIKDNKVTGEERLLKDQGERFRAITMGVDGALYAITDGGKLYKVSKK
jgi:glucose/arabinose dehydrogenase